MSSTLQQQLMLMDAPDTWAKITNTVASDNGGGGNLPIQIGKAVPAGSLVVMVVYDSYANGDTAGTVTDSQGNSYTLEQTVLVGGTLTFGAILVYASVLTTPLISTNNVTYVNSNSDLVLGEVSAWAGNASSNVVDTTGSVNTTSAGNFASATCSPSAPDDLFISFGGAFYNTAGSETFTNDSAHGWTLLGSTGVSFSGSWYLLGISYQIGNGVSSYAYAPSGSGTPSRTATGYCTFKLA